MRSAVQGRVGVMRPAAYLFASMLLLPIARPPDAPAQERDSIHGSALTATPAIAKLLDPFRGQLDSAEVADVLDRRKRYTGFPRNAEEHVLAARLWWRAGHFTRALRELDELRDEEVGPLSRLERARVLLETDSARATGVQAWWAACEAIDEPTRAEVAWDILPLTNTGSATSGTSGPNGWRSRRTSGWRSTTGGSPTPENGTGFLESASSSARPISTVVLMDWPSTTGASSMCAWDHRWPMRGSSGMMAENARRRLSQGESSRARAMAQIRAAAGPIGGQADTGFFASSSILSEQAATIGLLKPWPVLPGLSSSRSMSSTRICPRR